MAFQIDPNIPLQAGKVQFDPASILMEAQKNGAALEKHRLEMQKLREDYDLAKEKRKQEKAMQMGIASDLERIQSGTQAQYSQPSYAQTMPTGQMSQGMTGVLASERGQNMPQPKLFGENILQGNVDFNREMVSPAVQGREPLPIDFLKSALKQSMLNRDYDNALKFQKAIQESEKTTNEYYGGLTEGIDPKTGQPVLLAMTKTGAVPSGYAPKPKDPKAPVTWPVDNDRVRTTYGLDANGKPVVLGRSSLDSPKAAAVERPEHYFPDDGLTGNAFLATLPKSEQSRILAIATARAKLPSYQAIRRDPTIARVVEGLYKAFPDYDETQFAIRQGAGKAFAYGKQGDKLRSFGTAVQHIETLLDIANGLQTGDLKRVNAIANIFGKETGYAPPITMEAVQQLVADEILASIVPGAGGVEERLQLAKKLSGNNSYDVLKQVTERFQEMMRAQGSNLKKQAEYGGVDTSKMPDYTKHGDTANGGGGKDPYAITKDMNPKYVDYLMAHKELVRMKDFEGAKMLTEMYKRGAK